MTRNLARLLRYNPMTTAAASVLAVSGCAVWQLRQAAELVKRSEPLAQRPDNPALRLLVVGDSTGVGTGTSTAAQSLAGLIAQRHPNWLIENRARDGGIKTPKEDLDLIHARLKAAKLDFEAWQTKQGAR